MYDEGGHYDPVLLIKERGKPANLPGGKCGLGEDFIDAIKRELIEEMPLSGKVLGELITHATPFFDSFGGNVHSRVYVLHFKEDEGGKASTIKHLMALDDNAEVHDLSRLKDQTYVDSVGIAPYTQRHAVDAIDYFTSCEHYYPAINLPTIGRSDISHMLDLCEHELRTK